MIIHKKNIERILLLIHSFDSSGNPVSGLLFETMSLGTKRRLQKISKELLTHHKQLNADMMDVNKSEEKDKEMDELLNETVTIDCEHVSISEIDKINSPWNYDSETIEMIAQ